MTALNKKTWALSDAQALADEFPYTFHKPSPEVVSSLNPKNQVKLIFSFDSDDPEVPSAERMWVDIKSIENGVFTGSLDNEPEYIKDLKYQDNVEFRECHIIDTDLDDPVPSRVEKYIKRCFVTKKVLYDGAKVGYLYKEEPDYDDDSGWRFLAGDETDEYMDSGDNSAYVSVGAVLREDDSFVHLLDREEGVAFLREENGEFIELDD